MEEQGAWVEGQSPLRAVMLARLEMLQESVCLSREQLMSLAVPLCSAPDAEDHPEWGSPLVLLLAQTWHAHLGQKCFSGRQLQQLGQGCPTWSTGGAPPAPHLPQTCSPNDQKLSSLLGWLALGLPPCCSQQLSSGKGKLQST